MFLIAFGAMIRGLAALDLLLRGNRVLSSFSSEEVVPLAPALWLLALALSLLCRRTLGFAKPEVNRHAMTNN